MDKSTQTKYIVQPTTINYYYSPHQTLRIALAASPSLVKAVRTTESTCEISARKQARDEHGETHTAPARHATLADRCTPTTVLILTHAVCP